MNEREMRTKPARIVIPDEVEKMATAVVDAAFEVHTELGPGLLETAYESCFAHELALRGIAYQRQLPVPLNYKGKLIEVGFRADIVVGGKLLIELKAVEQLAPVHKAQVVTYLKLMRLPLGLLINFNEVLIKNGIRRILNFPKKTAPQYAGF
ncbi:MAG: GxxExxY protein [Verrucomicrobiia bacterium]|jgi:GxxExxY protein